MYSIPAYQRLASAAAVFLGSHGAVARLARHRHCSRQALYRQAQAVATALDAPRHPQRHADPPAPSADVPARYAPKQRRRDEAVGRDADRLAHFAATAQALGVSLSATRALWAVLRPRRVPSVATLGRLTQQAGRRAGTVLAVLDAHSRPKAKQVAADEIFAGRKPVLMTVEQDSLCWLGGRRADSRDSAEWVQEFRALPAAEQVSRDGGQGMEKGLALVNAERADKGQAVIADQEDHFHLLHRGQQALRALRRQAAGALRKAEQAQRSRDRQARNAQSTAGNAVRASRAWRQAEAAFDRWSAQERAWERLRAALRLFTPLGQLNTRPHAEAQVRAALEALTGPEWSRVRTKLVGFKVFTFLDRAQEQLAALPAAPELIEAAVQAEGLRRSAEALPGERARAAAARGVLLAVGVVLSLAGRAGTEAVAGVRGVLRQVWRASSLVEGLNSVLRMHQGRHKRLTQGLLDLKRLYWNLHVFAAGRRKGQSPYGRLGVVVPEGIWWELLNKPPEQLRQELSALNPAP